LASVQVADPNSDVFVLTDSDGRPPRHWLQRLVGALHDARWAAVTTFRWFLPRSPTLSAALASAWNAPIATLGAHTHNFCWGGGTAIRRQTFEGIKAVEYWKYAVSDDYALANAIRNADGRIGFLPECIVASRQDPDWRELLEWTTRQIIITRVYAPKLWLLAALSQLVHCAGIGLGLILIVRNLLVGFGVLNLFVLLLLIEGLAVAKGALRLVAMMELLPAHKDELLESWWVPTLLAPLVPWLYLYNIIISVFWRRITWRGVRYHLHSPWRTTVLRLGH
jgi:cellulose synthase/poly-beta-1,6-N-acetylglucosamine synthase-like glycosyltransferase